MSDPPTLDCNERAAQAALLSELADLAPLLSAADDGAATSQATALWQELKTLSWLSLPIMGTMLAQDGMVITNQVMIGYLVGTTESLAAAGVGNTIFSIAWFAIVGASSALDTMGSQSWGAGDRASLLKWGCVCCILLLMMNAVAIGMLAFAEPIALHLLSQSEETSAMVGTFCCLLIPGVPPFTLTVILHKMLQIQGRVAPPMLISGVTFLVNIAANFIFIRIFNFNGAPLATSASRVIMLLLTIAYLTRQPLVPESAHTLSVVATKAPSYWKSRGAFVVLAMQGALMMGLEEGGFNVTTAFAARLGDVDVAAHAAVISVLGLAFYSFPYAIAVAASIRVGELLGAQKPRLATVSAYVAVAAGGAFMVLCGTAMACKAHAVGRLFTANDDVVDAIASIAPLAGIFQASHIFDGIQGTCAGALRGMGRQREVLVFTVLGIWCVGIVSSYLLAFPTGLELRGLWVGTVLGVIATAVLNSMELLRVNWHHEARLAAIRTGTLAAADAWPAPGEKLPQRCSAKTVEQHGSAAALKQHASAAEDMPLLASSQRAVMPAPYAGFPDVA
ncbi:mate-domain-containing protein [Tribonema minus]|uniref:Mate-domain-containing protein n=1 Tax=Tribonema minus TaxID=303371 RepID=A0A835Z7U4_9STRA|nr:mate-domain-containing protein [Tribonema minus]